MATGDTNTSAAYRAYGLGLMTVLFTLANIDRSILAILIEPIKREYGLSDTQVGTLTGLAFAVPYALFVVPLGALADRVNRVWLITVLMFAWSSLTALTGLATSFVVLVLARMALGAAEAGCAPTLTSLAGDMFPAHKRGAAMGWLYFSSPLGVTVGLAAGGVIAGHFGWRTAFYGVGLPGIALALLTALTLKNPPREQAPATAASTTKRGGISDSVSLVLANRRLLLLLLGGSLSIGAQAAASIFMAPFLIRVHGLDIASAGTMLALTYGIGGMIGMPLGGYMTDFVAQRWPGRELTVFGLVNILVWVVGSLAFLVSNWHLAIALLSIFSAGATMFYGVTFSSFVNSTPARQRASTTAVLLLAMNLYGYGVAPQVAGILSDLAHWFYFAEPLRLALVGSSVQIALGGILFILAGQVRGSATLTQSTGEV